LSKPEPVTTGRRRGIHYNSLKKKEKGKKKGKGKAVIPSSPSLNGWMPGEKGGRKKGGVTSIPVKGKKKRAHPFLIWGIPPRTRGGKEGLWISKKGRGSWKSVGRKRRKGASSFGVSRGFTIGT